VKIQMYQRGWRRKSLPNPFSKETNPIVWEPVEGRFGCFEKGCGKVTGDAKYCEATEILKFTCPDGHENSLRYSL
jgi:hypothetical protein